MRSAIESKENSKKHRNGHAPSLTDEIIGLTFDKNGGLLITRPRQISIVEDTTETVLHSSKTGKATSFSIPAVACDQCIFALQSDNQQLVCFFKNSKKMLSANLESPAVQLAALHGSTVFGVCQNGRIFLASMVISSLKLYYLGESSSTTKQPMTDACRLSINHRPTKRKRDERHVQGQAGVCFLRQNGTVAEVVSYTWGNVLSEDTVVMVAQQLADVIPADLKGVTLLGAFHNDTVCVQHGNSVFSFSRTNGRQTSRALLLPSASKHVCLAGSGNVAYVSAEHGLILMDLRRGLIVARAAMESSNGKHQMMLSDHRGSRLVVISKASNKTTSVAATVITQEDDEPANGTTLASILESSIVSESAHSRQRLDKHCVFTDGRCQLTFMISCLSAFSSHQRIQVSLRRSFGWERRIKAKKLSLGILFVDGGKSQKG